METAAAPGAQDEMPADQTGKLFEIQDPEIDPDAIMAQIQQRLTERRRQLGYDQRVFPTFGAAAYPGEPTDVVYDPTLYHHLRLANDSYGQAETGPLLAPSPATRVPVLGRLWQLIRNQAHGLVLFYVNRAVASQVGINRHLVSVLNRMAVVQQDQAREIAALRAQLTALGRPRDGE